VLEVNAIYFILLVEGFGVLLFLILVWILIAVFRLRRKGREIRDLAARFKQRAQQRGDQTEAFLQAVYQLEDQDLRDVLQDIDKHESDFFQLLVASLHRGKSAHIASLDGALDKLIESYKCLQPRVDEHKPEAQESLQDIATLRNENDELRSELSVAKNNLSDMITEFGNMFGGGKDHELDLHELKKKLAAMQAGSELDINL
jgi:cbb3-type cytochrome oxidase subunit 3